VQLQKTGEFKQHRPRWEACFDYIEKTPEIQDIVVSGGDSFYLLPNHLVDIGMRLISMPNIKKFRFASKGLAVSPNRFLDPNDGWLKALTYINQQAEKAGKRMALHTHFNHPNEISWITEKASRKLREAGITVRNQTVLLRGINDNIETMGKLIRTLSDTLRIQPVSRTSALPSLLSSQFEHRLTLYR
jgi:lysine 2,3-aminomutase